jgi:hypothetical protein
LMESTVWISSIHYEYFIANDLLNMISNKIMDLKSKKKKSD